ncbi:Phage terminase-like protein, large subunit [Klebsiella variicola]|nr:Phage terminase-like protein, large subunit [Klebsiella variicola]
MFCTDGADVSQMGRAGEKLELTDGDVIDHAQIKADFLEWINGENLKETGFDPWSATQFSLALAEEGVPLVEVPQTVRNFF